jgi:hypothetical protein
MPGSGTTAAAEGAAELDDESSETLRNGGAGGRSAQYSCRVAALLCSQTIKEPCACSQLPLLLLRLMLLLLPRLAPTVLRDACSFVNVCKETAPETKHHNGTASFPT